MLKQSGEDSSVTMSMWISAFIVFMALGCLSTVKSGLNPEVEPLKRHGETANMLKALFRREEGYDECMEAFMCVSSSSARMISGNIYDGMVFSMEDINRMCRDAEEFLTCYDRVSQEHTCGQYSTEHAIVLRALQNHFCGNSSVMHSMVDCANKRSIQTTMFGQFKQYLGWMFAFRYLGNRTTVDEKTTKLCRLQGDYFQRILNVIGHECGSGEVRFLCDVFSDQATVHAFEYSIRFEKCPVETFGRCRGADG